MVHDTLETILAIAALPESILDADTVASWPPDVAGVFSGTGLLRLATNAKHIICDQCGEHHHAEVREQSMPDGSIRHYFACPEAGRVFVDSGKMQQWTVDHDQFAAAIASALVAAGEVEVLAVDRAWRLGSITIAEQAYSAVLFLGAMLPGALLALTQAMSSLAADKVILLVLGEGADGLSQPPKFAAVIPLASVVRLRRGQLWVDRERIESSIPANDAIGDKPVIDETTMSVSYRSKSCNFSSRSKSLFALFKRLARRPGQHVLFNTMRQANDIHGDYEVEDDSIRSAMKRLRDRFTKARMGRLAKCLKTGSGDGGCYAVLDLSAYDTNSH